MRSVAYPALSVMRGKMKEPSQFFLFFLIFPSFSWFLANFSLSRGYLPPLIPQWLCHCMKCVHTADQGTMVTAGQLPGINATCQLIYWKAFMNSETILTMSNTSLGKRSSDCLPYTDLSTLAKSTPAANAINSRNKCYNIAQRNSDIKPSTFEKSPTELQFITLTLLEYEYKVKL